jgi:hypothetical protein
LSIRDWRSRGRNMPVRAWAKMYVVPAEPGRLEPVGRYSATLQYGKALGSLGGWTTGRSMLSAGTTTRVTTRAAEGLAEAPLEAPGVGSVGSVGNGRSEGDAAGAAETNAGGLGTVAWAGTP